MRYTGQLIENMKHLQKAPDLMLADGPTPLYDSSAGDINKAVIVGPWCVISKQPQVLDVCPVWALRRGEGVLSAVTTAGIIALSVAPPGKQPEWAEQQVTAFTWFAAMDLGIFELPGFYFIGYPRLYGYKKQEPPCAVTVFDKKYNKLGLGIFTKYVNTPSGMQAKVVMLDDGRDLYDKDDEISFIEAGSVSNTPI